MKATFNVKGFVITLDTDLGTITGETYNLRDIIKESFPGVCWNAASKSWTMDGKAMEARISEYHSYFTRVYRMEIVEQVAAQETTEETEKVIVETEMVNGKDGFYRITYYSDGTKSTRFVG